MLIGRSLYQSKQYEQTLEFLYNENSDMALMIKAQCFEALENKKEVLVILNLRRSKVIVKA